MPEVRSDMKAGAVVIIALLVLVLLPQIFAPGHPLAWPVGIGLYLIAVAIWLLLSLVPPRRLDKVVTGALGGLVAAFLAIPLLREFAAPPLGIGDSPTGQAVLRIGLYLGGLLIGLGVGWRRGESLTEEAPVAASVAPAAVPSAPLLKICDTSVLVDGRLADMAEAGFVDGELVIPQFILRELQSIADSAEQLKRSRGRRGLDIVKRLQDVKGLKVSIPATDFPSEREVDHKLLLLAAELGASLITNDFNLNKVARVRAIKVLNLNDLVNALKTIHLPGEVITTAVTRAGKEQGQGIAYLDDGTMVVIDGGAAHVGKLVRTEVTNIHQTTAGRMIFTRFQEVAKKGGEEEKHS